MKMIQQFKCNGKPKMQGSRLKMGRKTDMLRMGTVGRAEGCTCSCHPKQAMRQGLPKHRQRRQIACVLSTYGSNTGQSGVKYGYGYGSIRGQIRVT